MPAWYVITIKVHDRAAYDASGYAPAVETLSREWGASYVLRGRGSRVLEGQGYEGGGAVIMQWPDVQTALAFWNSPEYAKVKALRLGLADVSVTMVEG